MPLSTEIDDYLVKTGNPAVDTAILVIVSLGVLSVGASYLYITRIKPWLMSLKSDTAVIREHTENNHASAPNPNLRDDLDAKHHAVTGQLAQITVSLDGIQQSYKRVDGELQRVHSEISSLRSDISVERSRINKMMDK